MATMIVPGHDRDALAAHTRRTMTAASTAAFLAELVDEDHPMRSGALIDAVNVVGFDDVRIELEELAYDEWASAQADELIPSHADVEAARIAALG